MRLVAIETGTPCHDAEVDYLVVPAGMDVREERRAYDGWYKLWLPGPRLEPYRSFTDWLVWRGARVASGEIEVYRDDDWEEPS